MYARVFIRHVCGYRVPVVQPLLQNTQVIRNASFRSSEPVGDLTQFPEVEIVKNPSEWRFVERLIAPRVVPVPLEQKEYPSGWKPPSPKPDLKYHVNRTKNFMLPVYLKRTFRGQRILTAVRRIEGDIWQLEAELRYLIEKKFNKPIVTRINEMNGQIELKGDYVTIVEEYLLSKGL
ncbi:probable 39S ribosomal protein L49, mitochondrial [Uranotaenia lowii]|uniref:probable 39S ribosomal protein L49, mitochondrial n=1 Tax=Uranotaenia lowii TaxID=190385 RepID=UPI0024798B17|nr:probable 39S ribosomal protein L49, mitochondrial [Uranotaenia lowii]